MAGKAFLLKAVTLTVATAVAGTATFLALRPNGADPAAAQAWIDDPLDGSVIAPAPLGILAHAYDPSGVTEVALLVNGEPDRVVAPDHAGLPLVWVQVSWVPPGPGTYLLTVVGRDGAGQDGLPGQAVVLVSPPPVPAPTTTAPSPSPTVPPPQPPPPATTPPPAPCTPPMPILLQPADGTTIQSPGSYAPVFTWSAWRGTPPDCPPSGFRIQVSYGRTLVGADMAAEITTWQPAPPLPCGPTFTWRVAAKRSDGSVTTWSPARAFSIACAPA